MICNSRDEFQVDDDKRGGNSIKRCGFVASLLSLSLEKLGIFYN